MVGIFVGGAARRMGGVAKGLLPSLETGEPLVAKLAASGAKCGCEVVLVGRHPAYAALALPVVEDALPGAGPFAGLVALLEHAAARGFERVVALACDMAFVGDEDLRRLVDAPPSPLLAARSPQRPDRWEPFFAAYAVAEVLPTARTLLASGERRLQALFDALPVAEVTPTRAEALEDWDTEADVSAAASRSSSSSRPS